MATTNFVDQTTVIEADWLNAVDALVYDVFNGATTVALARTALGLGTADSPQFTGIEVGNASDTTLSRASAGDIAVEGNLVYRAGGTDVPLTDGGTGASTASGARTNLNVGIKGYLFGLTLSNNGSDATNDIDIAAGEAVDSTGTYLMALGSAMTKQLDAAWAAGTNQGGLFSGSIANTTYHVFLIRKDSDGTIDAGFDTSVTAANIPSGYTAYRRIGSILRESGAIVGFTQKGNKFMRKVPVQNVDATSTGTSAVLRTLSTPVGLKLEAIVFVWVSDATYSAVTNAFFSDPDQTDTAASDAVGSLSVIGDSGAVAGDTAMLNVFTNTSAQIRSRLSASAADITLRMSTHGWIDTRGTLE